jgi:hypothetical protein
MEEEVVGQDNDYIEICFGTALWVNAQGLMFLEEDFNVAGEVWRVHKNDPDPYPSNPHAHCIAGAKRFVGCKLHLGSAALYDAHNNPLGRFLHKKQFNRLIELIQPKFPGIKFPLETT